MPVFAFFDSIPKFMKISSVLLPVSLFCLFNFFFVTSLPGVGNKTASVYQNTILKMPRIAVDTHVFRVANRTGIVRAKTTDLTQLKLEKIVPKRWLLKAHHLLILHGRYVCKSQKPLCKKCSIRHICEHTEKNLFY